GGARDAGPRQAPGSGPPDRRAWGGRRAGPQDQGHARLILGLETSPPRGRIVRQRGGLISPGGCRVGHSPAVSGSAGSRSGVSSSQAWMASASRPSPYSLTTMSSSSLYFSSLILTSPANSAMSG